MCAPEKFQKESRHNENNELSDDGGCGEKGRRGHALHSKDYCSSALHTVELMKSVIHNIIIYFLIYWDNHVFFGLSRP